MNAATPLRRRLATLACAASLVVPMSITAAALPASAATRASTAHLVDYGRGPGGYGYGYPSPYGGP